MFDAQLLFLCSSREAHESYILIENGLLHIVCSNFGNLVTNYTISIPSTADSSSHVEEIMFLVKIDQILVKDVLSLNMSFYNQFRLFILVDITELTTSLLDIILYHLDFNPFTISSLVDFGLELG